MKTVFTAGVFDLLHWGHFELFRRCKELSGAGGKLIVAIQKDDFVTKYKPEARLCYSWSMRARMISAIRYVDSVVPYGDIDESVKEYDFNVFAIGGDQTHVGFVRAAEWCKSHGRDVVRFSRTEGISSSQIRAGGVKRQLTNGRIA